MRFFLAVLLAASAPAQFVTPNPAVMPAWLTPYPGAAPETRRIGNAAESKYSVAAPAHDVLAHFRALFASARLPFEPDAMGYGFLIRSAAPECDLSISIRRREPDTAVEVTCSPRLAVNERIEEQQARKLTERAQSDPMKEFDKPVYPSKAPAPPPTWPAWLVRVDGAKLPVERLQGQLKSSFLSQPPRENIQAFYAGLLAANGYQVKQGLAAVPAQFGAWVNGSSHTEPRRVIWVDIKPVGQNFKVEIRLQ